MVVLEGKLGFFEFFAEVGDVGGALEPCGAGALFFVEDGVINVLAGFAGEDAENLVFPVAESKFDHAPIGADPDQHINPGRVRLPIPDRVMRRTFYSLKIGTRCLRMPSHLDDVIPGRLLAVRAAARADVNDKDQYLFPKYLVNHPIFSDPDPPYFTIGPS